MLQHLTEEDARSDRHIQLIKTGWRYSNGEFPYTSPSGIHYSEAAAWRAFSDAEWPGIFDRTDYSPSLADGIDA